MKRLGEMMRREPNAEQREALQAVLEVALAWKRGELPTESAARHTTGRERYHAMRFAELGSEGKRALMGLVDAILALERSAFQTPHGTVNMSEVYEGNAKAMTNWEGKRVIVWPMFSMDGIPTYPRVDLEPGEARLRAEEAMMAEYREYRKRKMPKGWTER